MVVNEKLCFEARINNLHKAQLYFTLGRAELSDIHRFPTIHMVKTHFLLENLWISQPSLGILYYYFWAVLFLWQMH